MKMKQILPIVFFSVFLLSFSCSKIPDATTKALQRAEECMEAHPDSALFLLQEIPTPWELTGKNQADYGLLMTQALDKNHKPLDSDSLIRLAIGYYKNTTDDIATGKACFYYGRYLFEAKRYKEALDVFLKSQQMLKDSRQYKLLGLLSEYIGGINMTQEWYDEALSNYKESLQYYIAAQDSLSMTFALRNIGRGYLYKNNMDSVFFYCTSALKMASDKGLKSEPSLLHELSVISRLAGNYEKAETFMLSSIDKTNADHIRLRYLSLGILYFQAGKHAEAEKYLKKSLVDATPETLSGAYSYLYRISRQKEDYKEMVFYIEKRDSIRSLLIDMGNQKNIVELQKKYRNEQLEHENLRIRSDKNSIILLSIIVVLIVLVIAIYHYSLNQSNKRKIKDIEHDINLNEQEILNYKMKLSGYNESMMEHQDEMDELKGKIALLTNQNKYLTERLIVLGHEKVPPDSSELDVYIIGFRTLVAIKKGVLNRKLSDYDFTMLVQLFNFLYNNFVDRLIAEVDGLSKHEIELCCLLKLRLTNQELCQASNTTLESVRKAKARLKNRLKIPADGSLETYLANY